MDEENSEKTNKKLKDFASWFKKYYFREIDPDIPLFHAIDPWIFDELSSEEKKIAEKMLIEGLKRKIDKRWLYGLEELKSKKGYAFLLKLFAKEKNLLHKAMIAYSLIRIDPNAPVLEFVIEVLQSNAGQEEKKTALSVFSWMIQFSSVDENTRELLATALQQSMMDNDKKVREYAYSLLMGFFGMSDFTPLNDPIKRLLTEGDNIADFRKAVQMFEKRVGSKEVHPFSKKLIVKTVNELTTPPPPKKLLIVIFVRTSQKVITRILLLDKHW